MSQENESENVKLVRRLYELFNALDPDPDVRRASEETRELLALFEPEVEFIQPPGVIDSKVHQGREAFSMRAFFNADEARRAFGLRE
jgi:hypothetical protein